MKVRSITPAKYAEYIRGMDRKKFNKIYAKYFKKDYFGDKAYIRQRVQETIDRKVLSDGRSIPYGDIKRFLRKQKEQCWAMIEKRLDQAAKGIFQPQREKFTWAMYKAIGYK